MKQTIAHVLDMHMNLPEIAEAFGILDEDVLRILTAGGSAHTFYEAKLSHELGYTVAGSDSESFSLKSGNGRKYGVRCMHQNGVSFARYSNVGAGRKFNIDDFIERTESLMGYYVVDTSSFPTVPVYYIKSALISALYEDKLLRRDAYLSRETFLKLLQLFKNEPLETV